MNEPGVYVIQSFKNHHYYIGSTDNIERRLHQHNQGWVIATKNLRPFNLKVFLVCENLTGARKAERRFKKYKRKDIIEKVIRDKNFPWNYMRV